MAVAARAIENRPQLGIVMMLIAWLFFAFVDTGAKWLIIAGFPAFQLAFMRYAGHFAISIALIARGGIEVDRFRTTHLWQVVVRAGLLISATILNFYALNFLPLSVTSTIMFSSPIIVCLLSWPLLGERVGPWRWFAIVLGFVGVLIVIRPFGETFHLSMLLVIYNAFSLALYSIMTRKLSGLVATDTLQFYMGALGTFALLPFALWSWVSPTTPVQWFVLFGLGGFAWAGHQLMTNAHGYGSASTLMPYTYSFIIYISVLSYFVFNHVPDSWTMIGATVIVVSGLIIWKRQNR